jgi:hypothetical protein
VTSKHNALHGELVACKTKCLGLKQDATTQQQHCKRHWEYVTDVFRKNKETFVAHTSTFHAKWGTMPYLLLPIWTRRGMDFGHLLTHVPSVIPNHFNGGKEMSTM